MLHELELGVRALLAPAILAARWMIPRAGRDHGDLPVARPRPALTAKMFLDELFFSTEVVFGKIISSQDCRRISSEVVTAVELYERRGWLDEPARYHCTPPALDSPDPVRDLWRHWDRPRLVWYEGGHLSLMWAEEVRALLREALTASGLLPLPRKKIPRLAPLYPARFAA